MKRILFFLFPFKICIQVFVFWVLHSLAPGEITVFCNDTKASLPPRKGGFTWIPKGCWLPATLGEKDGVLWGREASTSFSEMPRMPKEGLAHGSLCKQEPWEQQWGSAGPSLQKLEMTLVKDFSVFYLESNSKRPQHDRGIKYREDWIDNGDHCSSKTQPSPFCP